MSHNTDYISDSCNILSVFAKIVTVILSEEHDLGQFLFSCVCMCIPLYFLKFSVIMMHYFCNGTSNLTVR